MDIEEKDLEKVRKRLATCRRIYKLIDGTFIYKDWREYHRIEVCPAEEYARVIFTNRHPVVSLGEPRLTTSCHNFTFKELDYIVSEYFHEKWCETEAVFFAAEYGSLNEIDAYVLSKTDDLSYIGRRNALTEDKAAFAIEYYQVIKGKEGLLKRKKVTA